MNALIALTIANIRSYMRDRAAVFWTLAFPLIFIVLFGLIFQGGGGSDLDARLGRRGRLGAVRAAPGGVRRVRGRRSWPSDGRETALASMQDGEVDAVIVVPAGYGAALGRRRRGDGGRRARSRSTPTRRARSCQGRSTRRSAACSASSTSAAGHRSSSRSPQTVQTENLNFISYFVPSMLGLSVMQVGIFAAIPLVADREKLILKRLAATPLRALAAGRLQRPDAAAHRHRPGGHHRGGRLACSSASR